MWHVKETKREQYTSIASERIHHMWDERDTLVYNFKSYKNILAENRVLLRFILQVHQEER